MSDLRAAALRLLGRRDYTSAELQDKLVSKGADAEAAADVLTDLRQQGLVDDRRVAAAHVRTASRLKRRGRARIARELAARGLDRDVVDEALAALPRESEAEAIAEILLRKRVAAKLSVPERRRIFQHLLRRGFSAEAVAKALAVSRSDVDDR